MKRDSRAELCRNRRHGGVAGVILIIVGLFVAVLAMAVWIVVKTVRVNESGVDHGKNVSIELPGAQIKIQAQPKLDPSSIGVPIYPGAVLSGKDPSGGASLSFSTDDGKDDAFLSVSAVEYVTRDSVEKVVAFYKGKLKTWTFAQKKSTIFEFELTDGKWKRVVGIREKSDGTHIGVASVGERAGN